MPYHIDQSGKMESAGDTALALSNDREFTISIPASVKRAAISELRWHPRGRRRQRVYLRLFAVGLYYLIKELPAGTVVIIDREYTGHEKTVKALLLTLLWRINRGFGADDITFDQIGKQSSAHKKALAVYRGEARAHRTLTARDLLLPVTG